MIDRYFSTQYFLNHTNEGGGYQFSQAGSTQLPELLIRPT